MAKQPRIIYLLGKAQHQLSVQIDRTLVDNAGITSAQAGCLFFLEKNNGCAQKVLSQGLGLDTSAMTGMVERLSRKGLVLKRQSTTDRRASTIHITEDGRAALSRVKPLLQQLNAVLEHRFGSAGVAHFCEILEFMIKQAPQLLHDVAAPAPMPGEARSAPRPDAVEGDRR